MRKHAITQENRKYFSFFKLYLSYFTLVKSISYKHSILLFITWKKLIAKCIKRFERADVQKNTAMACDLVAWSRQVRIHISPCGPAFHVQSRIYWLSRSRTRTSVRVHCRTVSTCRSIVYERAETIPVAAIYMRATWRHGEIIYVAKSNSPVWRPGSCTIRERRTRTRHRDSREIHFSRTTC